MAPPGGAQQLTAGRLLDHAARWHGEREVVEFSQGRAIITATYRSFVNDAKSAAAALLRMGVRADDCVATLAWTSLEHLQAWWAVQGIGAICQPTNPRLSSQDLIYTLNHAQAKVLILDASFYQTISELRPELTTIRHCIVISTEAGNDAQVIDRRSWSVWHELLDAERNGGAILEWPSISEDSACGLCYTSGTTGRPKGVLYSHRTLALQGISQTGVDTFRIGSATTILPLVPPCHVMGWGIFHAAMVAGAKLVLPGRDTDAASLFAAASSEHVSFTAGAPILFNRLVEYLDREQLSLPSLKLAAIGGDALPAQLLTRLTQHGIECLQTWGMTETAGPSTFSTAKGSSQAESKVGKESTGLKQGRPVVLMDCRILDDSGEEITSWDGTHPGHLHVRGPNVITAYYKAGNVHSHEPEGWFITGDVGNIDHEGFLQLTDRTKDIIRSGGEWISSLRLEQVACEHAQVKEAATIGVVDSTWGQRPLMFIVLQPGAHVGTSDIAEHLTKHVPKWWLPADIVAVDRLPRGPTGKLLKAKLNEIAALLKPGGADILLETTMGAAGASSSKVFDCIGSAHLLGNVNEP